MACGLFLLATSVGLGMSWQKTAGHLTYALDDPYIHMAMAKNLATHGVWGVSANHFSSSSSSPIWTAVLAAIFFVIGVRDAVPLVLNLMLGVALLFVVHRQLDRSAGSDHPWFQLVALGAVIFVAPLPALTFAGLEHILHALVVLLFLDRLSRVLASPADAQGKRQTTELCMLAAALPLIRFESIFLIGIAVVLLALRRRFRWASGVAVAAALPLAAYGGMSRALGWYWLPNSVILKGTRPAFGTLRELLDTLGYISYSRMRDVPAVGFMLSVVLVVFAVRGARGFRDWLQWKLAVVALMTVAHMQFAQPQPFWFYRYEAYLLVAAMVVVAEAIGDFLPSVHASVPRRSARIFVAVAAMALFAVSPLTKRAVRAFANIPTATANIYEQHYQIGLFLKAYYSHSAVALNDIGLPSYAADLDTIDLVGLANMDVARLRLLGWYGAQDIDDITAANGVRVAVVYDSWFQGSIPSGWRRVGTWTIQNNVVTGGNTVTFYATTIGETGLLRQNLREFGPRLPRSVAQAP